MSQFRFNTEENGYSVAEVDRYITRLQDEYRNAVEWSNEIEKRAEEAEKNNRSQEVQTLRTENEKLNSDCRLLAARLRELMQLQSEAEESKEETARQANEIINNAQNNAAAIISGAQAHAEQIVGAAREQASAAIRDAEGKSAAILEKVENECQTLLLDATQKIEALKNEFDSLNETKKRVSDELGNLISARDKFKGRIEEAEKLLDF